VRKFSVSKSFVFNENEKSHGFLLSGAEMPMISMLCGESAEKLAVQGVSATERVADGDWVR
jgi:hypothetical protein